MNRLNEHNVELPRRIVSMLLLSLLVGLLSATANAADRSKPACVTAFESRLAQVKQNLPAIRKAAEAAAARVAANPDALITVPYSDQSVFAEEILNRAGGLSNALPVVERRKLATPNDIMLMSARCWETDEPNARKQIEKAIANGWLVVFFGSKAGLPDDLTVDHLIDNFALDDSEAHAPINALTNTLNVWLWTCEYYAALTRKGKYPGILLSILMDGSDAHNAKLQKGDRRLLGKADEPIEAGVLAADYLKRVDQLLEQMMSEQRLEQIEKAAQIVRAELAEGNTVGVTTCTHFLLNEVFLNRRTKMKPFQVVWRAKTAFKKNLQPGDLVVWFGYVGMSTKYEDYFAGIRNAKLRLIASYVTDQTNEANNAPNAVAFIQQDWLPPDAEVKVPYPPGHIAPVSGINQGLLLLMLEEAVAGESASH